MKTWAKIKQISAAIVALAMITGCIPELLNNESPNAIDSRKRALESEGQDPPIFRSPIPEGEAPEHRQNRPTPAQSMQERSAMNGSGNEPCEAEALITSDGPALVFRNLSALQTHLPFSAALSALSMDSGGLGGAVEQEAIMQSMFDTFGAQQMINSISNTTVNISPRLQEAGMNAAVFIGQMKPLAAFNRLDLAANDGSICGEQRITYALGSPVNPQLGNGISGQFTIIFEARYPNPLLDAANSNFPASNTIADCAPVAEFWENIALMNDDNDRGIALSEFFFTGHTLPSGIFLPPVVTVANYQSPMGQIRTNQFVESPWELREFRTSVLNGTVELVPDTNKGNPITGLYDANSAFSQDPANAALRTNFLADLSAQMDALLAPEINGLTAPELVLTSFEPSFGEAFSGFTSQSQGSADNPFVQASADVRSLITNEINARLGNSIPANSTVNDDQILHRIGAMTCGGCHQFSGGQEITDNVDWPFLGGTGLFVHVRDTGGPEATLSTGLLSTFLPLRRQFLLDTWLCEETDPGCVVDEDCDDGFICVAGECVEEPTNTECEDATDCPYGEICVDGECVMPQLEPVLDACREPHVEVSETVSVIGNSHGNVGKYRGTCGGPGSEDVVAFTPRQPGVYCLDTRGSEFETVLHVRENRCQSGRSEIACATSETIGRETFAQLELDATDGTYYIFVDSAVRGGGEWVLTINEGPCRNIEPEPIGDNACENPHAETSGPASFEGDSSGNQAEFTGSCGGVGPEEVSVFVPEESGVYCVKTEGSEIETALYIRAGICETTDTELACATSRKIGPNTRPFQRVEAGTAEIEITLEAADTYFIFVDALENRGGSWVLKISQGGCRSVAETDLDDDSTRLVPSRDHERADDGAEAEAPSRQRASGGAFNAQDTASNEDESEMVEEEEAEEEDTTTNSSRR